MRKIKPGSNTIIYWFKQFVTYAKLLSIFPFYKCRNTWLLAYRVWNAKCLTSCTTIYFNFISNFTWLLILLNGKLTCLAVWSTVTRLTPAWIFVNTIHTNATVLTWATRTLINICMKHCLKYHNCISFEYEYAMSYMSRSITEEGHHWLCWFIEKFRDKRGKC